MSKKRQKTAGVCLSKQEPGYWRTRLFKPFYAYKGTRRQVRNWYVKIQLRGSRKTFPLRSSRRAEAAMEACELYRRLVVSQSAHGRSRRQLQSAERFHPGYWAQRLIQREYAMKQGLQLSVRIDHAGTGFYFPLGTGDRQLAASRAVRIFEDTVTRGWEWVTTRYSRELTVAFRWLEVPLAWTYTTIHTATSRFQPAIADAVPRRGGNARVIIVEPDEGVRGGLQWCLDHMPEFRCTGIYRTSAEFLREAPRQTFHLALISNNLTDSPGATCLRDLRLAIPEAAGVLYSSYEDSEELFRATPGGAGTYLLKRTSSTRFLEPVAERLRAGRMSQDELISTAWQFFKGTLTAMPVGGTTGALVNLTQREMEVLTLISKGHPDKDIADQLGISIYTVHEHVRKILDKLGAHNRTEAAVRLLQK